MTSLTGPSLNLVTDYNVTLRHIFSAVSCGHTTMFSKFVPLSIVVIAVSVLSGCKPKPNAGAKSAAPAKVEMVPHESELASILLTEDAEKRLAIEVSQVVAKKIQRRRTFGGEAMLPPGKIIQVTSPVGGTLLDASDITFPVSGQTVKIGETLLRLAPQLSPERDVPTPAEQVQMTGARATLVAAQVASQGDVERFNADVVAAKINVDRARKLLADRAGSQRAVDDAVAILNVASANHAASQQRLQELTNLLKGLDTPASKLTQAGLIEIKSPLNGILRSVSVSPQQPVIAGAAMFEVIDTTNVWIRVPVFVDLLSTLNTECEVRVVKLDGSAINPPGIADEPLAKPVVAPPSADPNSATVDVYYEVSHSRIDLRPGQRVGVSIPVSEEVDAVVLPSSSILYDFHGCTWVYQRIADRKYQRRKVNLLWFDGEQAVIENRLESEIQVVTSGAAELFGTEFGPGK